MKKSLIILLNGLQAEEYYKGYLTALDVKGLVEAVKFGVDGKKVFDTLLDFRLFKCCGNGRYRIQFDPDVLEEDELEVILNGMKDDLESEDLEVKDLKAINYLISRGYTIIKNN